MAIIVAKLPPDAQALWKAWRDGEVSNAAINKAAAPIMDAFPGPACMTLWQPAAVRSTRRRSRSTPKPKPPQGARSAGTERRYSLMTRPGARWRN